MQRRYNTAKPNHYNRHVLAKSSYSVVFSASIKFVIITLYYNTHSVSKVFEFQFV